MAVEGSEVECPAVEGSEVEPETGRALSARGVSTRWLLQYPVVSDNWDEFLEVCRQGNLYRYPRAVTVNRSQLADIICTLFETKSLCHQFGWITELEYARQNGHGFKIPDGS